MQQRAVHFLLLAVVALVIVGFVSLFSTGAFARESHGDAEFFLKRQALWLCIGGIGGLLVALLDYRFWRWTWLFWFGLSALLLALCFVPPFGVELNNANRWINLGFMTFQPSELAKIAAVAFIAAWFSNPKRNVRGFFAGFVIPLAVVGILIGLIIIEVDIGTSALIGATVAAMMFVGGTRLQYLSLAGVLGLAGLFIFAVSIPERRDRLVAFLDIEAHREGAGLQQYLAIVALGSGGVKGLGLGEGRQKISYLPYAHTDFIFPMIGEELGLRATLAVVFAYLVFVLCGTSISLNAADRFGKLFGFGLTTLVGLQAIINIGVTTGVLPNKGLPLPFISYGGSNLLFCLLATGILVSIHRGGSPISAHRERDILQARVTPRL